jgi:hypothetical protein
MITNTARLHVSSSVTPTKGASGGAFIVQKKKKTPPSAPAPGTTQSARKKKARVMESHQSTPLSKPRGILRNSGQKTPSRALDSTLLSVVEESSKPSTATTQTLTAAQINRAAVSLFDGEECKIMDRVSTRERERESPFCTSLKGRGKRENVSRTTHISFLFTLVFTALHLGSSLR